MQREKSKFTRFVNWNFFLNISKPGKDGKLLVFSSNRPDRPMFQLLGDLIFVTGFSSLDYQSVPTNQLTQLHELSTMNGTEEDLSSILKREEVELPGLHGAVNETTRRSRRPGRVRPRIRLKTEQVRRCYLTSFHNSCEQKSLAEKDRIHLEKALSEAAWQGETITQLKRRELFLTRW